VVGCIEKDGGCYGCGNRCDDDRLWGGIYLKINNGGMNMSLERELLFIIYRGDDMEPCKIYSDGTVEGFPGAVRGIANYHIALVNAALVGFESDRNERYGCNECPIKRLKDAEDGRINV
jgi:hypothetical protein